MSWFRYIAVLVLGLAACGDSPSRANNASVELDASPAREDGGRATAPDASEASDAARDPSDAGRDAPQVDGGEAVPEYDAGVDGSLPTPSLGSSVEVGRTPFGSDFAQRADAPANGSLFSVWTRIPDPGASYPWLRGNMDVYVLRGANWHLRCLVGNIRANSPSDASYNANSMLFAGPEGTWIDDFSYYASSGQPEAPFRDWVWAAWQVLVSRDAFTIRQWLKFGVDGPVQPAGESIVSFADARDQLVVRGWSREDADAWTPGDASSFQVGLERAYLMHARMEARATAPSLDELNAVALHTRADTSAWADYPFTWLNGAPDLHDRSGHGRDLMLNGTGTLQEGPAGPDL